MRYLIDGYNLLHKLEALRRDTTPAAVGQARGRLLRLLHDFHGAEATNVTVVFDARRLPRGVPAETEYHGLRVRFAVGYPEADDLLEELMRSEPAPHTLTVVSD